MTARLQALIARGLLALAGLIVTLDFILPSTITLIFDELALLGVVWAMKRVMQAQVDDI